MIAYVVMQALANDIVRYFAFTLQAKTLLALATGDKQHVAIAKDKKMQHRLQKHHERRQVRRMYQTESWMREEYILPDESQTQVITYKSERDNIHSLYRFQPGEVVLSEGWYDDDGFPEWMSQRIHGVTDGVSYETTRMRGADYQLITTMKLTLHEHGKWIASVRINDDTCEAYKLAYRRIKTLQGL